ncbi:MAG TPA: porin family protein [Chryseolinea sp.]
MKKIIITLFFASAALYSFSQTQFAIGIKAGPNFANIDTDASAGEIYESRTGWHAGAFLQIRGEKVGFQPEVIFSQQGQQFKYSSSDPSLERNFSYVNIPLVVKLYTVAGLNLQVGPQIGFLTSAEQEDFASGQGGPITEEDIKGDMKKTDFSLALGVGWDLPFGLTLDGRYNWGLSDNDDGVITNSGAPVGQIKNQVWQISVGFKLFKN